MKYLINSCTDPHWNMAHDEFLLEGLSGDAVFCLWQNAPAVIIGLNQSAYAEVNLPYLESKGIALARRVTLARTPNTTQQRKRRRNWRTR